MAVTFPQRHVEHPRTHRAKSAMTYAETCVPDAEWQRAKLESLRWRFGYYQHTPWPHILKSIAIVARPIVYVTAYAYLLWMLWYIV